MGYSLFGTRYARFLQEANLILDEPTLQEAAGLMMESAEGWNQIATGLLPDSRPNLKRMRELMVAKNRLFEEQNPGALQAMLKINGELDTVMEKAMEDLRRPLAFLAEVQQNILRCREIENKAFEKLNGTIQ